MHAVTGWRRWLPWVLVVVAAIIGLVSSLNVWATRQGLSTDAQRIYPLLVVFGLAYVGTEVLRRQTLREFASGPPSLPAA